MTSFPDGIRSPKAGGSEPCSPCCPQGAPAHGDHGLVRPHAAGRGLWGSVVCLSQGAPHPGLSCSYPSSPGREATAPQSWFACLSEFRAPVMLPAVSLLGSLDTSQATAASLPSTPTKVAESATVSMTTDAPPHPSFFISEKLPG